MDSIRLTCLKTIVANLSAMAPPDYGFKFSAVHLGPITSLQATSRSMAGVVAGKELVQPRFPLTECMLPVELELRITWDRGDPAPGELAELLLENVQRKMMSDPYLGGSAIDIREEANEVVMGIFSDKTIEIRISYLLMYRYLTLDPRQPV